MVGAKEIYAVVHRNTAAFLFRRFNTGNISFQDQFRSVHPFVVDDDDLLETRSYAIEDYPLK